MCYKWVISTQVVFELHVTDLRDYKCKVNICGKIYQTISKNAEQRKPSLQATKCTLLLRAYNNYLVITYYYYCYYISKDSLSERQPVVAGGLHFS